MTPRTERERIERVVGKDKVPQHDHMNAHNCIGKISYFHPCDICGAGMKVFMRKQVISLIRRELAKERGRVRRIIKVERAKYDTSLITCTKFKIDTSQAKTGIRVCNYLLAALSGRKG